MMRRDPRNAMRISPLFLTILLAGCGLSPMGAGGKDSGDTGAAPAGVQIPDALDFGSVAVGETATDSVVIRNYTDDDVALLAGELAGDPAFFLDSATIFPMETEAGGQGVVTIGFTPNAEQDFAAELSLTVQGEAEDVVVSIAGVGGAGGGTGGGDDGGDEGGGSGGSGGSAAVSASPGSVAFGGVYTNETGVTTLSITNNEESDILVTGLQFSDPPAFAWQASSGESFNLAQVVGAGSSKSIDVYFQPGEERAYSETLTVETDAGDVIVPLSGTGLEPLCTICDPDLVVTTNGSDAYSMELAGLGTAQANIVLRNASDVDLTLSAVNLVNDGNQGDFTLSGITPQVIGPGATVSGTITYACVNPTFGLCIEGPDLIFGTPSNTVTFVSDDAFESNYEVGLTASVIPL
jgi:hypothetical protein